METHEYVRPVTELEGDGGLRKMEPLWLNRKSRIDSVGLSEKTCGGEKTLYFNPQKRHGEVYGSSMEARR